MHLLEGSGAVCFSVRVFPDEATGANRERKVLLMPGYVNHPGKTASDEADLSCYYSFAYSALASL